MIKRNFFVQKCCLLISFGTYWSSTFSLKYPCRAFANGADSDQLASLEIAVSDYIPLLFVIQLRKMEEINCQIV